MKKSNLLASPRGLAVVSAILIVPGLLLCLSGWLQLSSSNVFIHPLFVLAGLTLAIALNAMSVLSAQAGHGNIICVLKLKGRSLNLGLLGLSLLLLATIMAYGFVENFRVVPR